MKTDFHKERAELTKHHKNNIDELLEHLTKVTSHHAYTLCRFYTQEVRRNYVKANLPSIYDVYEISFKEYEDKYEQQSDVSVATLISHYAEKLAKWRLDDQDDLNSNTASK